MPPATVPDSSPSAVAPLRQVTIIGHNSQIVPAVGLFVGGRIPVRVYTPSSGLELALAPYPGVTVTRVEKGFDAAPSDLPPPPYFVATDDHDEAERIRAWLPPTVAVFRLATERALRKPLPGFLSLHASPGEIRRALARRMAVLRRVDQLQAMARGAKRPLILMYGDPDPDGIGSALGLHALWSAAGAEPVVRYAGEVQRYQNRLLIAWLKTPVERLRDEELAESDLIAVVDAQPGFWKDAPPAARVVIDHHPRREDTQAEFLDLRVGSGATATIVAEYLLEAGVPIGRQLATALLYGITTDTDDLKRNAGPDDIAVYEALLPRIDKVFRARLDKSQIPMPVLDWISWGIGHRVVHRDLVVIHFGYVPTPDIMVQVADLVLLTCGIAWVVCAGIRRDDEGRRLVVVFRGDGHTDVGRRARQAFGKLGSAGGHRTMGRAEIPLGADATLDSTVDLIVDSLFGRLRPGRRRRLRQALIDHLAAKRPVDPDTYELTP
jgi:nanoRNase/pAp phosphatase (c-di-AMP/oligoRNAs hydrolase)